MKNSKTGMALTLALAVTLPALAQNSVPMLVNYGGVLRGSNSQLLTGAAGVTFLLYKDREGGAPLWMETQNVTPDPRGRYTVTLGTTRSEGLPAYLFADGAARWLGVQVAGRAEEARVALVAVPYAMKAKDADTIGGLPASAFVLAAPASSGSLNNAAASSSSPLSASSSPASPATSSDVTTTGGTVNAVPLFTTSTNIQNSILTQTGTTAVSVAGALKLPATGAATSTAGKNSRPQDFVASSFNSSTSTAENQTFQWQAEPASNDTTSPSGTLNLLYGLGATAPAETGLKLSSTGMFTFASGQTFPGTGTITGITTASGSGLSGGGTTGTLSLKVPSAGITNAMLADSKITLNASTAGGLTAPGAMTLGDAYTIGLKTCSASQVLEYVGTAWTCTTPTAGTVTSVASGAGLTGGPITGSGTLSIPSAGVTNAMLANSKVTLNSGTGITAPGAMTLGDTYTVSINTAVVPQLAAANTFTNLETINAASASPALNITNTIGDGINISATSGAGIQISAPGDAGIGVIVENAGAFGVTAAGDYQGGLFYGASGGTYSQNDTDSTGAVAAYAFEFGTTQQDIGFWGHSASTAGVGVYGQAVQASVTGPIGSGFPIGVWGDTGSDTNGSGYGILGTADDGSGVAGFNNSTNFATAEFGNFEVTDNDSAILFAYGSSPLHYCYIDVSGNLYCAGTIGAVAPVDGGSRKVALNSVQSPEAWSEDAGSGQLTGGQAVVNIESVFGQTINTGVEYHVFLTPNGDCKGLYVAEKSASSFVVKELGGGTSSIAFDYRIMAKRKSFENVRLADVTKASTIRKRPVKSAANAKHLPSAQSIREQTQEHAKRRTVARLSGPVSNRKQ